MNDHRGRHALLTAGFSCGLTLALSAYGVQQHEHEGGAHRHPDAAQMKNPVAADATSIAAGKTVFQKNCASCHGETGKGDGKMGAELNPKPSDLTDADWKHGSTDGEIFKVIHDGSPKTGMKAFKSKLSEHEIWDVVNYVHSLGPSKGTSR